MSRRLRKWRKVLLQTSVEKVRKGGSEYRVMSERNVKVENVLPGRVTGKGRWLMNTENWKNRVGRDKEGKVCSLPMGHDTEMRFRGLISTK